MADPHGNRNQNTDVEVGDAQENPATQTQQDPFGFILDLASMSSSQEELVKNSTFVSGDLPSSYTHTQDVLHEENYSFPSSDVQLSAADHAVDADALDWVHLPNDSQLGSLEVLAESSPPVGGDALGDCTGVQSEKVKESASKGKKKLDSENDGFVSSSAVAKKPPACNIAERSEMQNKSDEGPSVLQPSQRRSVENVASEGNTSQKLNVFEVLRALTQNINDEDEGDDDPDLMKDAEAIGIVFPRPRWYPRGYNPRQ